jgi:hypothetical protein
VVVAGFSSAVRCYDGANGRERAARQFRKERYFIFPTFGALNEDGSRLVVAGCIEGHDHIEDRKAPGMVVLLDTKSLTEVKRYEYAHLEVSATGITSAAASADLSVVVVAASPDDHGMTAIRLWYPDNGNVRVLQLERYQEVLLSRNGRFLLVCNMSNKGPPMARAYKLPECEELWTLDGDEVLPIPTASAAPAR